MPLDRHTMLQETGCMCAVFNFGSAEARAGGLVTKLTRKTRWRVFYRKIRSTSRWQEHNSHANGKDTETDDKDVVQVPRVCDLYSTYRPIPRQNRSILLSTIPSRKIAHKNVHSP